MVLKSEFENRKNLKRNGRGDSGTMLHSLSLSITFSIPQSQSSSSSNHTLNPALNPSLINPYLTPILTSFQSLNSIIVQFHSTSSHLNPDYQSSHSITPVIPTHQSNHASQPLRPHLYPSRSPGLFPISYVTL